MSTVSEKLKQINSLIDSIVAFCQSRGEKEVRGWGTSIKTWARNPVRNRDQALRNLGWVKLRVERGEPIMISRGDTTHLNPSFDPEAVFSASFRSTLRIEPLCLPFLDSKLYTDERMRQLFTRAEYEAAVKAIAEKIREGEREIPQTVQRRCREDTWERLMLAQVERHLTPTGGVKLYVRKNLIDLAERVRNHEMLYHPDDVLNAVGLPTIRNEPPTNWLRVPASSIGTSRSLGRIGRRTAQRIGYEGTETEDGLLF